MVKARYSGNTSDLKRGLWSPEEDQKLIAYIRRYGIWNWTEMPKPAGREEQQFVENWEELQTALDELPKARWSTIAARLPGRTDNEIKNYWHTRLSKKYLKNNPFPKTGLKIEDDQNNPSKVDCRFPNAPKASNSDGYNESPMSSELSIDEYISSSASDPSGEIYEIQPTEENIGSSETYGDFQSLLEQSFSMENLYVLEGFGATVQGDFSKEEPQILLEQPFSMEDSDVMGGYEAIPSHGIEVSTSQWGFQEGQYLFPSNCEGGTVFGPIFNGRKWWWDLIVSVLLICFSSSFFVVIIYGA